MKNQHWLLGLLLILATLSVHAEITVEPIIIDHFQNGNAPREDITVKNTGEQTEYVLITPKAIVNPGMPDEKTVVLNNATDLKQYGLYVTPKRLILNAGQSKLIRVGFLNTTNKQTTDRIFRLVIEPKSNQHLTSDLNQKSHIGIALTVGYAILVIERAPNAKPNVTVTRNGTTLTFRNSGNSNVLLTNFEQCTDTCKQLSQATRLYAGNTWTTQLPTANPVKYQEIFGEKLTALTSP